MQDYTPKNICNIGLVGHSGSGKSVLCDAILFNANTVRSIGVIDKGTTVSDYRPEEISHQHSISLSLMNYEYLDKKINLIDAPGIVDFQGEMICTMNAADIAVFVINSVNGLEIGAELALDYSSGDNQKPKAIVVNMLDRDQSDFNSTLEALKERFGRQVFPVMLPVNEGESFNQVADVLKKKNLTFKTDGSGNFDESDLSDDLKSKVESLNSELIELIAESDESLLEKFFEQGDLSEDDMKGGLANAIATDGLIPVFCIAGSKNIGVKRVMDYFSKYFPSSADLNKDCNPNGKLQAFVFKTISEEHVGEISLFKMLSGSIKPGDDVKNVNQSSTEKFRQMYTLNGKDRKDSSSVVAGDIGVTMKLKETHTGDTLGDLDKIEGIKFPDSIMRMAVEPKNKGDEDKMSTALSSIHQQDPTFTYNVDAELKQTIISTQGELHLKISFEKIKSRFGVEVNLIKPKIPYRETITSNSDSKYRHKKQSGGSGQFAEVWLKISPGQRGEGVDFTQSLSGQNVDRGFVPSVEKGINKICSDGIIAGCKVVDLKIDFYDGKMHPVDSNDMAFQIAGSKAFIDAFKTASPKLLEPIYKVKVKVPDEFTGDIMGDISQRRGKVGTMSAEGKLQIINAEIPLENLHDYATALKAMSSGRGMFSLEFSHYEDMPHVEQQRVISSFEESRSAE